MGRDQSNGGLNLSVMSWFLAAVAGVLLCGALLVTVLTNAEVLLGPLVIIFQVFIGLVILVATALGMALSVWYIQERINDVLARIDQMNRDFADEISKLQKRVPSGLATLVLIGEGIVVIADKAFEGNSLMAAAAQLLLWLWFLVANQLMVNVYLTLRVLGGFVWVAGIALLPMLVLASLNFELATFLVRVESAGPGWWLIFGICGVVMLLVPFAGLSRESTG